MNNSGEDAQGEKISPLVFIISQQFLRILQRPDPRFLWKSLDWGDYKLSEQLCKDIIAAPYIDYLRPTIAKDEEAGYFTQIERAAACASEFNAAVRYPYTIILLLSVMRKFLAKNTNLYQLGKTSYEYHKEQLGRHLDRDELRKIREIVVELGIQIYRREGDVETEENIWPYLQLEFQYPEALFARRMQFYQTDDPRKLFRLTTARWLNAPAETKGYNTLEQKWMDYMVALHPQLLELPVPYGSADALLVAQSISEALREEKKATLRREQDRELEYFRKEQNRELLAKNLRIVQWDIFTRNLLAEQTERKLSYKSSLPDTSRGLPPDDFLNLITNKSCLAHCHYFPLHSGILRARTDASGSCKAERVTTQLRQYREGFVQLISKAEKYNPTSYDDVIEGFSYEEDSTATQRSISKALLVEDGELTFFVMLWLLRHAVIVGDDPEVWCADPSSQLEVDFCPIKDAQTYNAWWRSKDLASFAQLCGLTVPAHRDSHVVLTRRWRSLIRWLRRQVKALRNAAKISMQDGGNLYEALPVKKIRDACEANTLERSFVVILQDFFVSPEVSKYLTEAKLFPDEIPIEEFAAKHIGPLIKLIRPLLYISLDDDSPSVDDPSEPWPRRDNVLIRMSRAGFLPLEYLFRAYQPYELHLLLLALSFTKTELVDQRSAPVCLAFATIAGALLPGVAVGMSETVASDLGPDQYKEDDSPGSRARRWLAPYWTLFTALSTELSVGQVQEASKQIGAGDMVNAFSHELSKVHAYVFSKLFLKFRDVFAIEGEPDGPDHALNFYKWLEPAADISPRASNANLLDWRVCPTPRLLENIYQLYAVWVGSKVSLQDLNIPPHGTFSAFLHKLRPLAIRMAVARQMVEDKNPILSITDARQTEDSTDVAIEDSANIHFHFDFPPGHNLMLCEDTNNFSPMLKMYLARGLLAALSNAVQHTPSVHTVKVLVRIESIESTESMVVVEIGNPAKPEGGDPQKAQYAASRLLTKTHFGFGSEAVMQTCAKQLGGTAEITKVDDGGNRYLSYFRFPLPKAEESVDPWITLKAKSS